MNFDIILNKALENSSDKNSYLNNFLTIYKNFNYQLYPSLREGANVDNFNINGKYYLFERNEKFNFDYILFVPSNLKYNILLVEGNNGSGLIEKSNSDPEWLDEEDNRYIGITVDQIATSAGLELNGDIAIMTPIIPDYRRLEDTNGEEFFPRQYSRNSLTVTDENDRFYKFDEQMVNIINDAKKNISLITGINFTKKIAMYGFSTSAKFANRFTCLHPELVKVTVAGGVGAQNIIPKKRINNTDLIYPIGIKDIEGINTRGFNEAEFKKVNQFYYMGESDYNDTTKSRIHHGKNIIELYKDLFGNLSMIQRWNEIKNLLLDFPNIEFKTYPNIGHKVNHSNDDVKKFLYSNIQEHKQKNLKK